MQFSPRTRPPPSSFGSQQPSQRPSQTPHSCPQTLQPLLPRQASDAMKRCWKCGADAASRAPDAPPPMPRSRCPAPMPRPRCPAPLARTRFRSLLGVPEGCFLSAPPAWRSSNAFRLPGGAEAAPVKFCGLLLGPLADLAWSSAPAL